MEIQSGSGYTITGNTVGYANTSGSGTTNMLGVAISSTFVINTFPTNYTFGTTTPNATTYRAINCAFTAGGTVSSIQNNTVAGFGFLTSSGGSSTAAGAFCGIAVTSGNANIGTTTANTIGSTSAASSIYLASNTAGATVVGIYATGTGTIDIQNNTIGGIDASGTSATARRR